MQIRSRDFEIQVAPISLNQELPIRGGESFVQTDRPITFLHVHDCLELGYCYSGSGVFIVGEKVLPYEAGDVSFINHTEVHLASSAPGTLSDWTWIYLDPARLVSQLGEDVFRFDTNSLAGPDFNNILSGNSHPAITRAVLRMIEELRGEQPGRDSALRALTWELMILIQRTVPRLLKNTRPHDYERLAPALQMLTTSYTGPLRVGELASCCGLSEPHFRRLFTRTIGRSPRTYWNDLRLRMAASLLRSTGRSILEISSDVGFETLSSFNRLFLARFGKSPRAWRGSGGGSEANCGALH